MLETCAMLGAPYNYIISLKDKHTDEQSLILQYLPNKQCYGELYESMVDTTDRYQQFSRPGEFFSMSPAVLVP